MKFSKLNALVLAATLTGFSGFAAQATMMSSDPMVGGAAMYPSRNIVQNAVHSKDHTTLVAAVGRRPCRNARRRGPIHGLRADERSFRQIAAGHRR